MKLLENKNYIYMHYNEFEQLNLVMKVNKKKFAFEALDITAFKRIKGLTEISKNEFKTKYLEQLENLVDTFIDKMFENPIFKEKITNKVYFGQIKPDFSHLNIGQLNTIENIVSDRT